MPWSDWQDPFVYKLNPTYALLRWDLPANDVHQVDTNDNPFNGSYAVVESTDWRQAQTVTNAVQFRVQPTWPDIRDGLPQPLRQLERGVDYDVIPGKDPWADDAFVEYDPDGVNVWEGWGDDTGSHVLNLQGTGNTSPFGDDSTYTVTAQTGLALDTNFPEEPGAQIGGIPSITQLWGEGSMPGAGPATIGADFTLPDFPDPGNVSTFTMVTRATVVLNDGNDPQYAAAYGSGLVRAFMPHQRVILPRWRYWIPGRVLPLRQRQRDDGLGLSTGRWRRGRSRQVSNRWKGYL